MDWHYHKDNIYYTKEEQAKYDNIRAWQKAGFKIFFLPMSNSNLLECPHCASLVKENKWRLHLKSLHKRND